MILFKVGVVKVMHDLVHESHNLCMFGQVAIIAYIKKPITSAYGTNFMLSPFRQGVRQFFRDNRWLADSGVEEN